MLGSCVGEPRQAPRPAPTQAPRPVPARPAPPPPADWRDAPITAGDWSWRPETNGSIAAFAQGTEAPLMALRCDRTRATVTLLRRGSAAGPVPVTVQTTSGGRAFQGDPVAAGGTAGMLAVTLPARDPLLDAIAFSRGRIAVQASGLQTLYVPAWSEPARVVEDCR